MGNKTTKPIPQTSSTPTTTQTTDTLVCQKYALFDHIPLESVLNSISIETKHHFIQSIRMDIASQTFRKEFADTTHSTTYTFFGLYDFPFFLINPSNESITLTITVSKKQTEPLDLQIVPTFRPVSPEEYSLLRHTDIMYPIADFTGFPEHLKGGNLVFRAKSANTTLVIRPASSKAN